MADPKQNLTYDDAVQLFDQIQDTLTVQHGLRVVFLVAKAEDRQVWRYSKTVNAIEQLGLLQLALADLLPVPRAPIITREQGGANADGPRDSPQALWG